MTFRIYYCCSWFLNALVFYNSDPETTDEQGIGIIILYPPFQWVKMTHEKLVTDIRWRIQWGILEFLLQNLPESPFTMEKSTLKKMIPSC